MVLTTGPATARITMTPMKNFRTTHKTESAALDASITEFRGGDSTLVFKQYK